MTTPTRGLDFVHYCQFAVTPIFRATLTPGDLVLPEAYYEQELIWTIPGAGGGHDFVFTGYPDDALSDVQVIVSSRFCYDDCGQGVTLYWGIVEMPPNPIWWRPWRCTFGCDDGDPLCSPDNCTDNNMSVYVPKFIWNENFNGTIGAYVDDQIPDCNCSPDALYLSIRIRYLSRAAVYAPDDYEDDLTFEPYHGLATHHTAICGNTHGILSKALGEWRIDPHDGRMIGYHEWAPADDASNIRYAQGGLTGIHLRPEDDDNPNDLGGLCHGVVVHQQIEGMLMRILTMPDCLID